MNYWKTNEDNADYYHYTGPQRLDKAIHTLEGLVKGMAADGIVTEDEIRQLTSWIGDHLEFVERHPFNEVIPLLSQALSDGEFDEEEQKDVIWLCEKLTTDNSFFSTVTSDMQRLHGMMGGITADGSITKDELDYLTAWMDDHEHLRTVWPYDELEVLISSVLKDGVIDEREHKMLLQFFSEFTSQVGRRAVGNSQDTVEPPLSGVCAMCPEIEFKERQFCFTGRSDTFTRNGITEVIESLGGTFSKSVTRDLDYLVIGSRGNECWAYACYGRKVEQAVQYRKKGCTMLLVHENDFIDTVRDTGLNI